MILVDDGICTRILTLMVALTSRKRCPKYTTRVGIVCSAWIVRGSLLVAMNQGSLTVALTFCKRLQSCGFANKLHSCADHELQFAPEGVLFGLHQCNRFIALTTHKLEADLRHELARRTIHWTLYPSYFNILVQDCHHRPRFSWPQHYRSHTPSRRYRGSQLFVEQGSGLDQRHIFRTLPFLRRQPH